MTELKCNELGEIGISDTPKELSWADKDQNILTLPDLDEETTSKAGDYHVSTIYQFISNACTWKSVCGKIGVASKQDCSCNPVWCDWEKPSFHIYQCNDEFPDGNVTPLTFDTIVQAIYDQDSIDRNEYSLLKCLIDYRRTQQQSWTSQMLSIMIESNCNCLRVVNMFPMKQRFQVLDIETK